MGYEPFPRTSDLHLAFTRFKEIQKMTYALAKQLKDAGFDQFLYLGSDYWRDGIAYEVMTDLSVPYEPERNIKAPSLSELIKACGNDFGFLISPGYEISDVVQEEWIAQQGHRFLEQLIRGFGQTPEEAVSNLWIALNKK
jgi:hypothetical protein